MSYLFDKQGEGDAQERELEGLLGAAKFSGMTFPKKARRSWAPIVAAGFVAAAALALIVLRPRDVVRVGDQPLDPGQWIATKSDAPVTLTLARDIGTVVVEGNSEARVVRVDATEQKLELAYGKLHAVVNAPPRIFVVETPSARAVDLGCEYTLEVQRDGASRLDVISGLVELQGGGLTTTVLENMWSISRTGSAPQVAIDHRASPALISAVQRLASEPEVIELLLSQSTPRDAVTLFQLRSRVSGAALTAVEARLDTMVPRLGASEAAWWRACVAAR